MRPHESRSFRSRRRRANAWLYNYGSLVVLLAITLVAIHAQRASSSQSSAILLEDPYLGVIVSSVSRSLRVQYGLRSTDPGVEVIGVDPGSPAEQARIRENDLILYANDEPIRNEHDLSEVLSRLGESPQVKLTIRSGDETRDLLVSAVDRPPGYLGLGVVPLCDREEVRKSLPNDLATLDSLPVVSWVQRHMPDLRGEQSAADHGSSTSPAGSSTDITDLIPVGSVITRVNGHAVHSVYELRALTRSIRIGDLVSLGIHSRDRPFLVEFGAHTKIYNYWRGNTRNLRFLAQSKPKPWAGLRLEEMSPVLAEEESLSVDATRIGGLYARSVEPGSPAAVAGLVERDQILSFADTQLTSVEQFDRAYAELSPEERARASIWRARVEIDTVHIRRESRLVTTRFLPFSDHPSLPSFHHFSLPVGIGHTWYAPQRVTYFDWPFFAPFPFYTKITGPRLLGRAEFGWGKEAQDYGVRWNYGYGIDNERWQHEVEWKFPQMWLPTVAYVDGPRFFYNEEISNEGETAFLATFFGEDRLNYVHDRGFGFLWRLRAQRWPGHEAGLTIGFVRETAIANGVRNSSLFGRKSFDPNPVEGVTNGRFHTATLRYRYSVVTWKDWTRTLLDAEVRFGGGLLGGDVTFVRSELNASRSWRLARRWFLDGRIRAGAASDNLPFQESFYVGGQGTLPGYEDRELSGDRTLLLRARGSYVPFGTPEDNLQFRVFVGANAGNAWTSDEQSGVPTLRRDFVVGAGLFSFDDNEHERGYLFPEGLSIALARPIDVHGDWRVQFTFFGGAWR